MVLIVGWHRDLQVKSVGIARIGHQFLSLLDIGCGTVSIRQIHIISVQCGQHSRTYQRCAASRHKLVHHIQIQRVTDGLANAHIVQRFHRIVQEQCLHHIRGRGQNLKTVRKFIGLAVRQIGINLDGAAF